MYHAVNRAMSTPERQAVTALLGRARRQGSAWHFASRPLLIGAAMLVLGLTGLLVLSMNAQLSGAARGPVLAQVGVLMAAALALAGLLTAGYGMARLMLGLLMAGRTRDNADQTIQLLQLELQGGQVEQIELTLSGASRLRGTPAHAAWIARAGEHLLAIDGADLPAVSGRPASVLLRSLRLVVLPTSRRVLTAQHEGLPLPEGRSIDAEAVPDFARGYRPLRADHFPEPARGDLP